MQHLLAEENPSVRKQTECYGDLILHDAFVPHLHFAHESRAPGTSWLIRPVPRRIKRWFSLQIFPSDRESVGCINMSHFEQYLLASRCAKVDYCGRSTPDSEWLELEQRRARGSTIQQRNPPRNFRLLVHTFHWDAIVTHTHTHTPEDVYFRPLHERYRANPKLNNKTN